MPRHLILFLLLLLSFFLVTLVLFFLRSLLSVHERVREGAKQWVSSYLLFVHLSLVSSSSSIVLLSVFAHSSLARRVRHDNFFLVVMQVAQSRWKRAATLQGVSTFFLGGRFLFVCGAVFFFDLSVCVFVCAIFIFVCALLGLCAGLESCFVFGLMGGAGV